MAKPTTVLPMAVHNENDIRYLPMRSLRDRHAVDDADLDHRGRRRRVWGVGVRGTADCVCDTCLRFWELWSGWRGAFILSRIAICNGQHRLTIRVRYLARLHST